MEVITDRKIKSSGFYQFMNFKKKLEAETDIKIKFPQMQKRVMEVKRLWDIEKAKQKEQNQQ